jgi:hypothetical protein
MNVSSHHGLRKEKGSVSLLYCRPHHTLISEKSQAWLDKSVGITRFHASRVLKRQKYDTWESVTTKVLRHDIMPHKESMWKFTNKNCLK